MDPAHPHPPIDWDGHPEDIKARLIDLFPGWHILYTQAGWWATRSSLIREDLTPGEDLHGDDAQALYELLLAKPRRVSRTGGTGGGINA